jgi:hypothetical protein
VDGHQALVEPAVADRVVGALLALIGERVEGFARDVLERRDGVGADALMRLRMMGAQAQVASVHEGRRFRSRWLPCRHHLGAARDHEIFHAGHDAGGGEVHRA